MFIHTIGIVIVLVILLIASMFRVLREYERAVVFFLGRFYGVCERAGVNYHHSFHPTNCASGSTNYRVGRADARFDHTR